MVQTHLSSDFHRLVGQSYGIRTLFIASRLAKESAWIIAAVVRR
ncbi:hypothetical protein [Kamptonema sp. UHCC 0994]|nr:hypothetical protein [Kamptonema sp. UHCC 0994]MDF0555255.1 hypothetical protein [Kamptonema sp. UHCC 0994]